MCDLGGVKLALALVLAACGSSSPAPSSALAPSSAVAPGSPTAATVAGSRPQPEQPGGTSGVLEWQKIAMA